MINESEKSVEFSVMEVKQPIGSFYIGKMNAKDLIDISWFDVRRLKSNDDFDEYLGIQRQVSDRRVQEISKYVGLSDATFPTAVILAVEGRCASLSPINKSKDCQFFEMKLQNKPGSLESSDTVLYRGIARVLDGQHRIMGLKNSGKELLDFEINVCVFVDADIADQASIFATVNLAQTKVNSSLVYDLQSYSKSRSSERTCHTVTVTLDQHEKSPLNSRIKRLGVSTEGRFGEVLTQSTVVRSLLPLLTVDVLGDRDIGRRFGSWNKDQSYNSERLIFRKWFLNDEDDKIALQLMNYFEAVKRCWPEAWISTEKGNILPRTNGFRALMRFLRPAYNSLNKGEIVKMSEFLSLFEKMNINDHKSTAFSTDKYVPGSAGEAKLFDTFMIKSGLDGYS